MRTPMSVCIKKYDNDVQRDIALNFQIMKFTGLIIKYFYDFVPQELMDRFS